MKQKILQILPCLAFLILFTVVNFHKISSYYDKLLESSGLAIVNMKEELKKENERAIDDQKEYENMIGIEETKDETSDAKEHSQEENKLSLHALSSLLLDASNNRVLYDKNGYQEMPMASTTKIMTCIVALENSKPDEVVTVSSYAAKMPDVQLNIRPGEKYYLGDLLYSLMLESHNDVAVAIAEHVGGSVEGFAKMMNQKARELGCDHTCFVTPNGLDAKEHYTTARDLAVIASYAIKNDDFIKITNATSHAFSEINKKRSFTVSNKNRFLYMMDGAIGIKTGFTNGAGYCFVGAIKQTDKVLISVVLGCGWPPNKSLKWSDTKELMTYGIENYTRKQIFQEVTLDPLPVKDGQEKYENLTVEGDLHLLMREDEKVKIEYDLPKMLDAPVQEKSIAGYAKYYIDDLLYAKLPIYTVDGIDKIDYKFCINKVFKLWSIQY